MHRARRLFASPTYVRESGGSPPARPDGSSFRFGFVSRPATAALTLLRHRGDNPARCFVPLHPPLPPMWAEHAVTTLRRYVAQNDGGDASLRLQGAVHFARRELARQGYTWPVNIGAPITAGRHAGENGQSDWAPDLFGGSVDTLPAEEDLAAVADVLRGRILTSDEARALVEQAGVDVEHPLDDCLLALTLSGAVRCWPGVRRHSFGLQCGRCGETEALYAWDCAACGEERCWLCEACQTLGPIKSCMVLYAFPAESVGRGQKAATAAPRVVAPVLTEAQTRAASALKKFVDDATPATALVWAVCGAGKTEISFGAVGRVLAREGRVLFAIPRRDVVRELGTRLQNAFPDVDVQVLHGGSDRVVMHRLAPRTMTVATTHQVMRFYKAFDLVILDEVDAFPYRGSRMLAMAVARARGEGGRFVRMSATPGRRLLREADRGESLLVRVPVRHHGHPLPVPELIVDGDLGRADGGGTAPKGSARSGALFRPSSLLVSLIRRTLGAAGGARLLVFVPTIATAETVGRGLAAYFSRADDAARVRVAWTHAQDRQREAKLARFLRGDTTLFVATSILERGITVPDVDVIVLYSDTERIFQEPALVQMAGRVGRTVSRPDGHVAFVGRRITAPMRSAVDHIEHMNEFAAKAGLLS